MGRLSKPLRYAMDHLSVCGTPDCTMLPCTGSGRPCLACLCHLRDRVRSLLVGLDTMAEARADGLHALLEDLDARIAPLGDPEKPSAASSGESPHPSADNPVADPIPRDGHHLQPGATAAPASMNNDACHHPQHAPAPPSPAYLGWHRQRVYDVPDAHTRGPQQPRHQPRQRLHDVPDHDPVYKPYAPSNSRHLSGSPFPRHFAQPHPDGAFNEDQLDGLVPVRATFDLNPPVGPPMPQLPAPVVLEPVGRYSHHEHFSSTRTLPSPRPLYATHHQAPSGPSPSQMQNRTVDEGRTDGRANRHISLASTQPGKMMKIGPGVYQTLPPNNSWENDDDDDFYISDDDY